MADAYDLIIIGAGSGGLTAAEFAVKLGIKVALVEKERIGGDCTWTGCVPSKALLKAAKVAHQARSAGKYGIMTDLPSTDMSKVRDYVRQVIADIYQHETPEKLGGKGIDVVMGAAQFVDAHTIQVGQRRLAAKKFILATGAHPFIPPVPGLDDVPYLTYLHIFDNNQLPERLLVMGAGPIGSEIAQAYQRLGSQVTLIDVGLMPRDEPEVAEVMGRVFTCEGMKFVEGLVTAARRTDNDIVVLNVKEQEIRGDMLLVAVGRAPNVGDLALDQAGVKYSAQGIEVDKYLRTNVKHIYAVGDCVKGNHQFTHVAGWQAVQAVRNALLPGTSNGFSEVVPWTTFTDPEVAHVGLTEAEARQQFSHGAVGVTLWPMSRTDRAVAENDREGFIKVVHKKNGKVLGATVVASRAGEIITEFTLALRHSLKLFDLANVIHVYPTYAVGTMQLAGQVVVNNLLSGLSGRALRFLAGGSQQSRPATLVKTKELAD
jgi:pyruvate/2-oxoglutarate dehydrogenase complex dihydrolipoamide dehydrogenase (E3) component